MLQKKEAIAKLNELGSSETPFSFYCDWLGEHWFVQEEADTDPNAFQLKIGHQHPEPISVDVDFEKFPIDFPTFTNAFDKVVSQINVGNSFLTNLTFQTPIRTNLSLQEIFQNSSAKYKLLVPNQFVVFSPETFVQIKDQTIYSFPMKGTIDAKMHQAAELILGDPKELAEHVTIVDLIRNDLSQVAEEVQVKRFRYLEKIETNDKKLLQVSSEINGQLPSTWKSQLGTILSLLLPAGSISGAPKPETIRIIQTHETYERGYYTGICGNFDGASLDSGVMIRFIKQKGEQFFYCSGGGITSFSQSVKEYQEMLDKIYLPL